MNKKFALVILLDRIRILGHYVKENFLFSPLTGSVSSSAQNRRSFPRRVFPWNICEFPAAR